MFATGTRILMANGGFRVVEDLVLEEQVNGGILTEICWGLSDHQWYLFNGVTVAGPQEAWFEGAWVAVDAIPGLAQAAPVPKFCSLKTSTGRVFSINDTTFSAD